MSAVAALTTALLTVLLFEHAAAAVRPHALETASVAAEAHFCHVYSPSEDLAGHLRTRNRQSAMPLIPQEKPYGTLAWQPTAADSATRVRVPHGTRKQPNAHSLPAMLQVFRC